MLQWAGQTMLQMGQDMIPAGQTKAQGEAKELLASAAKILDTLIKRTGAAASPALKFQMSKAYRLNGEYKAGFGSVSGSTDSLSQHARRSNRRCHCLRTVAAELQPQYQAKSYDSR